MPRNKNCRRSEAGKRNIRKKVCMHAGHTKCYFRSFINNCNFWALFSWHCISCRHNISLASLLHLLIHLFIPSFLSVFLFLSYSFSFFVRWRQRRVLRCFVPVHPRKTSVTKIGILLSAPQMYVHVYTYVWILGKQCVSVSLSSAHCQQYDSWVGGVIE